MPTRLIDPLPAGSFTLSGKTQGPAVNLGRNRYAKSQIMFMHVDELRQACADAGWPNPETHQKALDDLAAAKADLADASEKVAAQADEIATLQKALGWKPEPKKKSAAKSTAKQ